MGFFKKILLGLMLASSLLLPASSWAQTTSVSGTVTDPNGVAYAGGSVTMRCVGGCSTVTITSQAQCIAAGAGSAPCNLPFSGTVGPVTLDPTGSFSTTLYSNTSINPGGSQWGFTVAVSPGVLPPWGTGPQSFTVNITVTGATQSVSSALNAAAAALTQTLTSGGGITCTTPGGIGFNNGTPNKLTCGPLFVWDSTNNLIQLNGSTSGVAEIGVNPVAGTPCNLYLPTLSPTAGQFLQVAAPSGSPSTCQTSWGTPPAIGSQVIVTTGTCGSAPNCFQVSANTRWVADGSITNTSPTVTSATINFTQADVGRSIYTVKPSTGLTKLIGTILSVTNSTTATASANATATETSDTLCVGTDDTAQLQAAWAYATTHGGLTVILPVGGMLVSAVPFEFTGASANPSGSYNVFGEGGYGSGTLLVVSPGFNFASLRTAGAAMIYDFNPTTASDTPSGLHIFSTVEKLSVTALGSLFSGASPAPGSLFFGAGISRDIQVSGFNGPGNISAFLTSTESRLYNINCQPQFGSSLVGAATVGCIQTVNGSGYIDIFSPILAFTTGFGIQFNNCASNCNVYGGIIVSVGSSTGVNPHASVYVQGTSQNVRLYGTRFNGGVTGGTEPAFLFVDTAAEAECYGCRFETGQTGANAIWVAAGGKLHLRNADLSAVTGSAVGIDNLGSIFDECGNISAASSTPYTGAGTLFGSCSITGTAAAAGNLAFSAGWGSTAAASSITGNTQRVRYTLTASGTGQAANPTITHTFATPFLTAPICTIKQDGGTQTAVANPFTVGAPTATSVVYTYTGTPGANNTLILEEDCSNP